MLNVAYVLQSYFPVCKIFTLFFPSFSLYFIYILQKLVFPLHVHYVNMHVIHSLLSVKGKFSRNG
jgi:hypothetical protein